MVYPVSRILNEVRGCSQFRLCTMLNESSLNHGVHSTTYGTLRLEAIALRLEAIALRLEAIALRLEAIALRLEAIALRLEAIALRLEAIALRLEAIALRLRRLEAIALRLEAIALRLEAIALRLEAIALRLEAIALRLEAIALWLEAIALRLEAIALRLEAIALRLEAIALRLEAIALRLEAIALRLEAIALRLEAIARHGPESPTSWCAGAGRALGGARMAYFDPEPWLGQIEDGSKIHIAGRAWYRDSHRAVYHCTTALRGQVFRLAGVDLKGDRFTIFSADKTMEEGTVVLAATNSTTLIHGMIDRTGSTEVIDICSGYGIMTAGYHLIGSKVRCHVEINDRYVNWLRARRQTVIAGDIDSTEVKLALLPYTKDPCIITGGFACQPFSQLGDGRQQYDPRARSFEGMVSACYLYQPVAMILECTKEALHSPWVQDTLQSFCQAAGYTFQQQLCHLHELWPAKRTRWWAVITHPGVQMPKLQCFPALDFQPSFRHLLPKIAEWPSPQIVELALQPHELDAFDNQPGGLGKNAVSPNKPLQTALHAWGSQLQACACGCRAGGFSDKRLEEKGLYGALIPLNGVTNVRGRDIQNMRHIHPDEVAILHLVPTVHIQGEHRSLRLDLTALGQMASPAQSIWHLAQVVQALDKVFGVQSIQNMAEQALVGLATEVFAARDLMLAPFVHTKESALFQQAFYDKFGRQSAAISPPVPHIVASVASDPKVTHGGGPKRKADIAHIDPTDYPEGTVVTATGGLEFFANKPNRVCPTKVPVPQVTQDVVQTSTIEVLSCNQPANPVDSTGRGKGKGGRLGPSHLPDLIMTENTRTQAPDEVPQNAGADSPQPQDAKVDGCHQDESFSLITDDQFAITVCSKDCAPLSIRVHKGATVSQLSQAEEGVSMLVQPIVVTTLTGVPLPLQSVLTSATWYVLADSQTSDS